jgi:uncharacterized protein (TIGR00255 family)
VFTSMTGFGAGRHETAGLVVTVEARSVNGRHLKVAVKGPPAMRRREQRIEALARDKLRRGTVTVSVFVKQTDPERMIAIDGEVVVAYQTAFRRLGLPFDSIPTLPGVLGGVEREELSDAEALAVEAAVNGALDDLVAMRQREGQALADLFTDMCQRIEALCAAVRERAPTVVVEHQQKLHDRLEKLLGDGGPGVDAQLVAREVALFADRCDVTEEVDRIGAHLEQIRELVRTGDEAGRRLEFLGQELLREANTIGSKSSDPELGRAVIDLKAIIEQLKEQAANIE